MHWNGPVWDFYRAMGPILAANLLTVAFVYACFQYSRREHEGTEKEPGAGKHLGTIVFVGFFLIASLVPFGFFDGILSKFQ